MAKGGYRKPNNPAPVSGPGKLSRRTDGGPGSKQAMREMTGGKYGENKALMEQQQGAPLAGSPTPNPQVTLSSSNTAKPPVTGLFAPTQRPDEPVTAGMPFGPGVNDAGSVANINRQSAKNYELADALEPLLAYDRSGSIRALYNTAVARGW